MRYRPLTPLRQRPGLIDLVTRRLQTTLKDGLYRPIVDEYSIASPGVTSARMERALFTVSPEAIGSSLDILPVMDSTLEEMDAEFQESIKKLLIAPEMTREQRERMAREYQDNLSLGITDWTRDEIKSLRQDVQTIVMRGGRQAEVERRIQRSYGQSRDKARFLARQETNLVLSKFKQVRYTESGLPEYIWRCVHMPKDSSPKQHTPGNVRFYHGKLDGKIFRWDTGAVVNKQGERKNPGQDYNCRCHAAPIVRF